MAEAKDVLDSTFMEMRWRALSLAADLDRIERARGGKEALGDRRVALLKEALKVVVEGAGADRAERVQMIFSDKTPPPAR